MGSSFCSCNQKDNKFEYKFPEEKNAPQFYKRPIQNARNKKFTKEEDIRLNEILKNNSIKKIQNMVRNALNSNKEMSTNINSNQNYKGKKNSASSNFLSMNISPILMNDKNNLEISKIKQLNLGDESTIILGNKSSTNVAISDITNIINNLNTYSDEKLKFNINQENEVSKFLGKKVRGKKEGLCFIYWNDIGYFKGYFKNNLAQGYGIRNFSSGEIFCGEFFNDQAQGFGIYKHTDGANYIGYIEDNAQSGIGIETWADGSTYIGEYLNGKKHGLGTNKWSDGSSYEGYWCENAISGYGIYHFSDGKYYIGQWKNNAMNGYGEFYWRDGKRYFGNYLNDSKDGFGIYYWDSSKRVFIGFWKNGKQEGIGKIINEKKVKYGFWSNGEKLKTFNQEIEALSSLNKKQMQYKKFFLLSHQQILNLINS